MLRLLILVCCYGLLFSKNYTTALFHFSHKSNQEAQNSQLCGDRGRAVDAIKKCLENFDRCQQGMNGRNEFEDCYSTPLPRDCPHNEEEITAANGYMYTLTSDDKTWAEARETCESERGSLATVGIRDCFTAEFIACNMDLHPSVWVGLTDMATEGEWIWIDNNKTAASNSTIWLEDQPNSFHHYSDCAVLRSDGRLNDLTCGSRIEARRRGLCEMTLP